MARLRNNATKFTLTLLLLGGIYTVLQGDNAQSFRPQNVVVIDGDTLAIGDDRYRLMGFDTPETYNAKCEGELALGNKATRRLKALIAEEGALALEVLPKRDRYQRKLARAFVFDQDVADIMISEGLARAYGGGQRQSWCSTQEAAPKQDAIHGLNSLAIERIRSS